jgi:hypothetical protein
LVHRRQCKRTLVPLANSLGTQRHSNSTKTAIVYRQNLNGRAADLGFPDQICTAPFKMVNPSIPSRMKQLYYLAGFGVHSGDIGTLALVAVKARKGQILRAGFAAVLSGYNVVDVKGTRIR